jgi:hypothetical protein
MNIHNPRPMNFMDASTARFGWFVFNPETGSSTSVNYMSGEILHRIGKRNQMVGAKADFGRIARDAVGARDDDIISAVDVATENFNFALRPYGIYSHAYFPSDGVLNSPPSAAQAGRASSPAREGGAA